MAPPPCCPSESDRYRLCLREKRSSGRKCDNLLRALEACRENWRKKHHATLEHDGTRVLTASTDQTARTWDVKHAEFQKEFKGHGMTVTSCAFSRDGTLIVTGSLDKTAKLWNSWNNEAPLTTLEGHDGDVTSVNTSTDGKRVITASRDKTARIWEVKKRAERSTAARTHAT